MASFSYIMILDIFLKKIFRGAKEWFILCGLDCSSLFPMSIRWLRSFWKLAKSMNFLMINKESIIIGFMLLKSFSAYRTSIWKTLKEQKVSFGSLLPKELLLNWNINMEEILSIKLLKMIQTTTLTKLRFQHILKSWSFVMKTQLPI